ncbi:hypothetical protein WCT90_15700 [Pectobacterium carotovorum]|uniref:hypothetical protein n=1 Tax=Pectobacterium carotovorum TaxID=554 RepID=UPI00301731D7
MNNSKKRSLIEIIADIEALAVAAEGLSTYVSDEEQASTYQKQILGLISRLANNEGWEGKHEPL